MSRRSEIAASRPSSEPATAKRSLVDILLAMLIEERAKVTFLAALAGVDPDDLPKDELQPYVDRAMVGVPLNDSFRELFNHE